MPFASGNAYFDGLPKSVDGHASIIASGDAAQDWLLYTTVMASDNGGVVVHRPGATVALTDVLHVNQRLLSLLDYPDAAAYEAAVQSGNFVHPDDLSVVDAHVRTRSSAVYDARLRRAGGTWRNCRIQGGTILRGGFEYRVTIINPTP